VIVSLIRVQVAPSYVLISSGNMVFEIINDFRQSRGAARLWQCDSLISSYCYEHCLAMRHAGSLYHAADCFLNGWGEAVAMCTYHHEEPAGYVVSRLIFCTLGSSFQHSELMLSANQLGCAVFFNDGRAYVCVRAKT